MEHLGRVLLVIASACTIVGSQVRPKPLTNDDVIQMVSAGLSDDVIIAKITSASVTNFDTSVVGLTALKTAKVSDAVLKVMISSHPSQTDGAPVFTDKQSLKENAEGTKSCPQGTTRVVTGFGSYCKTQDSTTQVSSGDFAGKGATLSTVDSHKSSTSGQGHNGWIMVRVNDVMSGKHGVNFGVTGTNGSVLKIQCHEGKKVDFIVSTGEIVENLPSNKYAVFESLQEVNRARGVASGPFVPEHQRVVKIKIDTHKPELQQWEIGQKMGDLFATRAKEHLKEILKAQVFYFQFLPSGQNARTLEFPVAGLSTYQTELKENCDLE